MINCGALSASLIESEMFGHVRGSFTGAERDRTGKFAEVGRGTLFLDEIDCLPLAVQAKLLRVVEDRRLRAGRARTSRMPVRARLIAASNRPSSRRSSPQRFRSDLYYRLNVIGFHLPPLRERRGAIPALVSKFLAEFAARNGVEVAAIAGDALRALRGIRLAGQHPRAAERDRAGRRPLPGPEIRLEDLPDSIAKTGQNSSHTASTSRPTIPVPAMASSTLAQIKRDAELARITEALEKHSNNRLRAASELGISRMTLYKKLYKYGLMQPSAASRGGVA